MLIFFYYLLILVLEFPFVFFVLQPEGRYFSRAIRASLVVQSVTYLLLFFWNVSTTNCSLMGDTRVVSLSDILIKNPILVCFIAEKGDDIHQVLLGSGKWEKIGTLKNDGSIRRLIIQKPRDREGQTDLFCSKWYYGGINPGEMVKENYTDIKKTAWQDSRLDVEKKPLLEGQNKMFNISGYCEVPKLFENKPLYWLIFLNEEGKLFFNFKNNNTIEHQDRYSNQGLREKFEFSMTNPIVKWRCTNATQIPGDLVLFQLGENQICLYDPNTKRIALVAKGNGPVAVLR